MSAAHAPAGAAIAMTAEQRAVVETAFAPGDLVHINATAGSGKTTTLKQFAFAQAARAPDETWLYIVFNREAQLHAKASMPTNVDARTFHSLALEVVTGIFAQRGMARPVPRGYLSKADFRATWAATIGNADATFLKRRGADTWAYDVFQRFLKSTAREITAESLRRDVEAAAKQRPHALQAFTELAARVFVTTTLAAWNAMSEARLPMTFDGLAKIMFMAKPNITTRYSGILIDESQDFSRQYLASTLHSQGRIPLVFVGDPAQRIYGWLGTANVFAETRATHTFMLSQSFRFGPAIAALAQGITRRRVEGVARRASRVVVRAVPKQLGADLALGAGAAVYIHRTNVDLLMHAVDVVKAAPRTSIAIVGRGKTVLDEVTTLSEMFVAERWKFDLRVAEAEDLGDEGQQKLLEWVAKDPRAAAAMAAALKERVIGDDGKAEAVFATVHGTKGLEWNVAVLSDDLLPRTTFEYKAEYAALVVSKKRRANGDAVTAPVAVAGASDGNAAGIDANVNDESNAPQELRSTHPPIDESEEWRLVYVALTRAKTLLVLPPKLFAAITKRIAYFDTLERPFVSEPDPSAEAGDPARDGDGDSDCDSDPARDAACLLVTEAASPAVLDAHYRKELAKQGIVLPPSPHLALAGAIDPDFGVPL